MAFCQYHLSHKLPVVGIPQFHCGYSTDNSIVKSQNFVYANLKFTVQGQNFSPFCGVAMALFKYSARRLFQDISPAYSRQRATLNWLDFHETTLAFSSASVICHGLLCIVGWPSASKPVSTWEIHTVSLFYGSQRSETAHQMLIKPSVLGQVLSNRRGQEHLIAICKAQQQQCLLCCTIHCTCHLSKPYHSLKDLNHISVECKRERKQREKKVPKIRT